MSNTKNNVFTIITAVIVPLLFFAALEGVLNLVGVGSDYRYFKTLTIDGDTYYQENPHFANQFYPPSLNVGPLQNTFAATPTDERLRVYVLGGSAAMGFPHKNHGFDRLLATQLKSLFPDRDVEVINTAMTSVNSHVVYEVARTLPAHSADVAVVLMGNNEVVGPYGPGTFNQNFLSNIHAIRTLQMLKRTRLWQLFDRALTQFGASDARSDLEWQGMQMFVDHGVAQTDPRMEAVYQHFETNLQDIIDVLSAKGMHVVVSTVPVNLRHSAPFLSLASEALTELEQKNAAAFREQAHAQALAGHWSRAQTLWEEAIRLDPSYADAHFQLATSLENQGKYQQAQQHYEHALDLDGLRFRADTQINAIIERVANAHSGNNLQFVDSAQAFSDKSAPHSPGWNLLIEHVHYDFTGHALLAQLFARAVTHHLGGTAAPQLLNNKEAANRIGFPNHETIANIKKMREMADQPPFPGQSNYTDYLATLDRSLSRITADVGSPRDVFNKRQKVLAEGKADWKLHFEMAALARYLRDNDAQYNHLEHLFQLYPHNRESYMNLAKLLSQDDRWDEVIPTLNRSLHYTRDRKELVAETQGWLGTAHLKVGETEKAIELLESIPKDYPEQIGMSLRAYGNLIKHSVDSGDARATQRYLKAVSTYADRLVESGASDDYPMLGQRMAQLMVMGGNPEAAARWRKN